MLWYSARSLPLPAYSVVATLNCVTCLPDANARISGSRVRRPARRTLFTVRGSFSGRPTGHGPTLRAAAVRRDDPRLRMRAYAAITADSPQAPSAGGPKRGREGVSVAHSLRWQATI